MDLKTRESTGTRSQKEEAWGVPATRAGAPGFGEIPFRTAFNNDFSRFEVPLKLLIVGVILEETAFRHTLG